MSALQPITPTAVDVLCRELCAKAGGWMGPFAAAGHALHYVPHPWMPPVQVAFSGRPQAVQPPSGSLRNTMQDTERGVHRLAPGGTLVVREALTEFWVRMEQGDRGFSSSWYRPIYGHRTITETTGAGNDPRFYVVSQRLRGVEPFSDSMTFLSGEADIFPRDARPLQPAELSLPALLGGLQNNTNVNADACELWNGAGATGCSVTLQSPHNIVPVEVLGRYSRLMLEIFMRPSVVVPAATWAGDARLPTFHLRVQPDNNINFMAGTWGDYLQFRICVGSPAEFCAANEKASAGSYCTIDGSPLGGALAGGAHYIIARWVLDNGSSEVGEVLFAKAEVALDGANVGGQYWTALPLGVKNRRVGVACDAAGAGNAWYAQLAKYLNLGWGFGDQLYTRALVGVDYDSVDFGPGLAAIPTQTRGPGGVAVGVTAAGVGVGNLFIGVGP